MNYSSLVALCCLLFALVNGQSEKCNQISIDMCDNLVDFRTLTAYHPNETVGGPFPIDDRDFAFRFVAKPNRFLYSILISKERSGVNSNQFRVDLHDDGYVAMFGLGVFESDEPSLQISRDPSGWYSFMTSNKPLPLHEWTEIKVERTGLKIAMFFDRKLVAEYQTATVVPHHNSLDFRVGSRYPASGSEPDYPFDGAIRGTFLHSYTEQH